MRFYLPASILLAPVAGMVAPAQASEDVLVEACSHFRGEESLALIRGALDKGADVNHPSGGGDTPLLLLCRALELDYRYRHEPAYRAALTETLELLLRKGADALHENDLGCNAIFFIEGQPELAKQLRARKLLPRELALRLPSGGAALSRYIERRAAQAACSTHEGSLDYLSRRYCAPIYDRVFARLQRYMRAESAGKIPPNALRDCLAFLRVADRSRISDWVDEHPFWEHSEHFLEEVPARFLTDLCTLDWEVEPSRLRLALKKLDSMLPQDEHDMIDCFAGVPMSQLLRMLDHVEAEKADDLIRKYAGSRDSTLAGEALCLQLERKGLPRPGPAALLLRLVATDTPEARRLLDMARVDEAAESGQWQGVDAATLRRVQEQLGRQELTHHAELLSLLLEGEGITEDPEAIAEVGAAWSDPACPSPMMQMARYIMAHPELFKPAPRNEEAAEDVIRAVTERPFPATPQLPQL